MTPKVTQNGVKMDLKTGSDMGKIIEPLKFSQVAQTIAIYDMLEPPRKPVLAKEREARSI